MIALFTPVFIIISSGFLILSSISTHLFLSHLLFAALGVAIIVFFMYFDWRSFLNYRWIIGVLYVVSVLLLIFVLVKGPVIRNVKSWIYIGPFGFQPVELAKISLILMYAHFFSRRHLAVARFGNLAFSFVLMIIPAILAAAQPALGSAIILFGIWLGFVIFSGLPPKRVALLFLVMVIGAMFLWMFGLKNYQKQRIIGIFYPEKDSLGINYSTIQSKVALGSAGFWGKGYGQGSQTQLGYLTEPESDFILAAFVEEWGWGGGLVILGAFLYLLYRVLRVGMIADRNFEKFFCMGTAMMLVSQFILNAGSTTGLLPVVGVTFPFLSYGGSSLLTNFLLLAIVYSIQRRS